MTNTKPDLSSVSLSDLINEIQSRTHVVAVVTAQELAAELGLPPEQANKCIEANRDDLETTLLYGGKKELLALLRRTLDSAAREKPAAE